MSGAAFKEYAQRLFDEPSDAALNKSWDHHTPTPTTATTPSIPRIPHRLSTNAECREWIVQRLRHRLVPTASATASANKFMGCGPQLYSLDMKQWQDLMGYYHGFLIRSLLWGVLKDEKKAAKAGMNRDMRKEFLGEVLPLSDNEDSELEWEGLYPISKRD